MTEQQLELPCNSCKYGKPLHLNKYGELVGGCWRFFFFCINPHYIKLKRIDFDCSSYERREDDSN